MRDELMKAIRLAYTMDHVADAIEAAIRAAYSNNPQHGYAAAIAVFVDADAALKEPAAAVAAGVEPSAEIIAVLDGGAVEAE